MTQSLIEIADSVSLRGSYITRNYSASAKAYCDCDSGDCHNCTDCNCTDCDCSSDCNCTDCQRDDC